MFESLYGNFTWLNIAIIDFWFQSTHDHEDLVRYWLTNAAVSVDQYVMQSSWSQRKTKSRMYVCIVLYTCIYRYQYLFTILWNHLQWIYNLSYSVKGNLQVNLFYCHKRSRWHMHVFLTNIVKNTVLYEMQYNFLIVACYCKGQVKV